MALRIPVGVEHEIVVVDNNSTDATKKTVEEFARLAPVVYVFEGEQGIAYARNKALSVVTGDYIFWTDDDVRVPSDWVTKYVEAIEALGDPDLLGSGVSPYLGDSSPLWLINGWEFVEAAYAMRKPPSMNYEPIKVGYLPFGANMVMRRKALKDIGFDTRLGRKGALMLSGEERKIILALLVRTNAVARWVPDNTVTHIIPVERQTLRYIHAYYAGHGLQVRLEEDTLDSERVETPRWVYRRWFESLLLFGLKFLFKRDCSWLDDFRIWSQYHGRLFGQR